MSLTSRVLRGSTLNLVDHFAKLVVMFLVTPLLVSKLGIEQYGVWLLLMTIVSFYYFLDFGITLCGIRFLARAIGTNDPQQYETTVGTLRGMFHTIGWICTGLAFLAPPVFYFFHTAEWKDEASLLLLVFGLSVAIRFFLQIHLVVLKSHVRYDWIVVSSLIKLAIQTTLIVVFLFKGYGIISLMIAHVLADLVDQFVIIFFSKRSDSRNFSRFARNTELQKEILRHSATVSLGSLVHKLRERIDPLLIAGFCSVSLIPIYSIGTRLILQFSDIINALLGGTLLAAFSQTAGKQGEDSVRGKYLQSLHFSVPFATFSLTLAFLYGPDFLLRWLGNDFYNSGLVLRLLAIPFAFQMMQYPSNALFLTLGKQHYLAWLRFAGALFNVALSILLVLFFGFFGIVIATTIEMTLSSVIIQPILTQKITEKSITSAYHKILFRTMLAVLLPMLFFHALTHSFVSPSYLNLICLGIGQTTMAAIFTYFFLANENHRKRVWELLLQKIIPQT